MTTNIKDFDGFYMTPDQNDIELAELNFFNTNEDMGKPIGNSEMGDAFHVYLYRMYDDYELVFDDKFDAIFSDPIVYALNIVKSGFYGMWIRKTEKSNKWLDNYANTVLQSSGIIN